MDGNNNQFEQQGYDPVTGQPIAQSPAGGTSYQYGGSQYGAPQNGNPQYGGPQYGNYQYANPQYAYPQYGYGMPQAPVFDERSARRHFSRIGLSYFVFWIASLLLGNGVAIVLYLVEPNAMVNYLISMLVALLPMYLIGAPLCWLCLRGVRAEKPEKNHWSFWQILGGFIVAYSMMHIGSWIGTYVGEIIESYIPDAQASTNSVQELVLTGEMWVNVMAMVIFGPIGEELLFRKFLCDRLKPFGDGVAIVVSGIMFGLFHGNITQGIYASMLGMIFAYVYLKTGNIFITIGYHVVANFMGSVLPLLLLNSAALGGLDEVMAGGDPNALSEFIMGNMDAFFLYGGYVLLIFGLMIAGVVILIVTVARGRVRINPGTYRIPSGKRFKTVFINVGMILFLLGCFSEVILNTFF